MRTFYSSFFILLLIFSTACGNKSSSQETKFFKIASYNVRNAKGMDNVTDFDRVSKVINDMDAQAVAIQELDSATERSKGVIVLDELAKRTKMHASFNGSIEYQGGKYGVGVLSKEKPLRTEAVELPGREEKRSLLLVEFEDYVLCCTHLSLNEEDRLESMKIIQKYTNKYSPKLVFLVGDLNASPDSEEMTYLSESWTMLNDPNQPTFPSDTPNVTIDYLLLKQNEQYTHKVITAEVVNEPMASDHRPLIVELEVTRK